MPSQNPALSKPSSISNSRSFACGNRPTSCGHLPDQHSTSCVTWVSALSPSRKVIPSPMDSLFLQVLSHLHGPLSRMTSWAAPMPHVQWPCLHIEQEERRPDSAGWPSCRGPLPSSTPSPVRCVPCTSARNPGCWFWVPCAFRCGPTSCLWRGSGKQGGSLPCTTRTYR